MVFSIKLAAAVATAVAVARASASYLPPKTLEKTWTVEFELAPGEIYNEWLELPMPQGRFVIESFNADIVVWILLGNLKSPRVYFAPHPQSLVRDKPLVYISHLSIDSGKLLIGLCPGPTHRSAVLQHPRIGAAD
jgi:hypothetical protein